MRALNSKKIIMEEKMKQSHVKVMFVSKVKVKYDMQGQISTDNM